MTGADARGPGRHITCPVCLDTFAWDESVPLEYSPKEGKYSPAKIAASKSQAALADARKRWYVQCPNPTGDSPNHYLPVACVDYPDPLVIALVGRPRSGKTHLVVAMIRELLGGMTAAESGLRAEALDYHQHVTFKRNYLDPFERGIRLPGTQNELGTYLTWLVVECGNVKRSLVFFDVAGEDFRNPEENGRYSRFLVNAGALLFVEDSPHVDRTSAEEHDLKEDLSLSTAFGASTSNEFITEAVSRLPVGRKQLPAVIALTKSDRLRYVTPADRWLRHEPTGQISADQLTNESRDVYAFLHGAKASSLIRLYSDFDRCTMHFVSATGGAVENNRFPAGIRPMRVLTPLLALFAMTGVISGPEARKVGR